MPNESIVDVNIAAFDIGTCTSACSIQAHTDDSPDILTSIEGTGLYPSLVTFDANDEPVVGRDARKVLAIHPKMVAQYAKKRIGSSHLYGFDNKVFKPAQIQGFIAKKIYEDLLLSQGWPEDSIVTGFTYPNMFTADLIEEYVEGLKSVGLNVDPDYFFSEALAAMTCVANLASRDMDGKTALIIDIGGGTTDVLVATAQNVNGRMTVKTRAIDGNNALGGVDFDSVVKVPILDAICNELGATTTHAMVESDDERKARIAIKAEEVKCKLCSSEGRNQEVRSGIFLPGRTAPIQFTIDRQWFIDNTSPLVSQIADVVDKVLQKTYNDARENLEKLNLEPIKDDSGIDMVIMIGGGTKVPEIRNEISRRHPSFADRIVDPDVIDPQYAVATGAVYLVRQTYLLKNKKTDCDESSIEGSDSVDSPSTTVDVYSRCKQAYGISARDFSDGIVKCFIHLYEGDIIPGHMTEQYYVPENPAEKLTMNILSVDGWHREDGDRCDLLVTKTLDSVSIPCPKDAKKGEAVTVDVSIEQNETLKVTFEFRGNKEKKDVSIRRM